jgi:predicted Rossmann fold flavoprotein
MQRKYDIAIVGGGAAGLMAAIHAAQAGVRVVLFEKNSFCGKKINITGKGRCTITNTRPWTEFAPHVHPVSAFLRSAFYHFSNEALLEMLHRIGLETVVERGERVYPRSMQARDVSKALTAHALALGVEILYDCEVLRVEPAPDALCCTLALSQPLLRTETVRAEAVIVATGGLSYPSTGSTGRGYEIARDFGHSIVETFPSLTALMPEHFDRDLIGIELKNVALQLFIDRDPVQLEEGEMAFTDGGIEGALGFRISRKAVAALRRKQRVEVVLDLKPGLSMPQLEARLDRELAALHATREELGAVKLKALLQTLMPGRLIAPFLHANPDLNGRNLARRLKEWRWRIVGHTGYERAVVTAGGVSQKELIAKTMRSRLNDRLYFAGEVIDLDGDTGGYNLQIAFSTGALAGASAAQQILKQRAGKPA